MSFSSAETKAKLSCAFGVEKTLPLWSSQVGCVPHCAGSGCAARCLEVSSESLP